MGGKSALFSLGVKKVLKDQFTQREGGESAPVRTISQEDTQKITLTYWNSAMKAH